MRAWLYQAIWARAVYTRERRSPSLQDRTCTATVIKPAGIAYAPENEVRRRTAEQGRAGGAPPADSPRARVSAWVD